MKQLFKPNGAFLCGLAGAVRLLMSMELGVLCGSVATLTQLTLMALARFLRGTAGAHDAWCCVCGVLPQRWHNLCLRCLVAHCVLNTTLPDPHDNWLPPRCGCSTGAADFEDAWGLGVLGSLWISSERCAERLSQQPALARNAELSSSTT